MTSNKPRVGHLETNVAEHGDERTYTFSARDIPAIEAEPAMPGLAEALLQMIGNQPRDHSDHKLPSLLRNWRRVFFGRVDGVETLQAARSKQVGHLLAG